MSRFFVFVILMMAPAVFANDYLAQLQNQARAQHLASDAQWQVLLHYAQHPITGVTRSLADDPAFFNAKNGQYDAQAELDATLASFFDTTLIPPVNQTAQCRFAARYHWLKQQLNFDTARLPDQACPRLQEWLNALDPQGVTLVFPSAYLNSPASMFGHTLLRIDAKGQDEQSRLLAYSISYAANADPGDGISFAIKGLAGMYPGSMANSPYYIKVREYTDMESRDIWEYQLTLSVTEIEQLLRHAWEIGATRFDYWFFDENCSYMLLTLIDAARPGSNMAQQFRWHAIPVDTVRAVVDTPGLVAKKTYRPAAGTELMHRAGLLSPASRQLAMDIADGGSLERVQGLPDEVEILEFADRLINFRGQSGQISQAVGLPRLSLIHQRRSAFPALELPKVAQPAAPETGHDPARLSVALGQISGRAAWSARLHPAYHDLMDPDIGYIKGAQIRFFDLGLSQRSGERPQADYFLPVDIVSLAPREDWYQAVSWRVRFGLDRALGREQKLAGILGGGPGLAWRKADLISYIYLDNLVLSQAQLQRGWALGSGALMGVLWDVGESNRVQMEVGKQFFTFSRFEKTQAVMRYRHQVDSSNNISLSWQWNKIRSPLMQHTENSLLLAWQRYF